MLLVSVKTLMTSTPDRNSINYELNVISNIANFAKKNVKSNRIILARTLHYFMSPLHGTRNYKYKAVEKKMSQKDSQTHISRIKVSYT